MPIMDELEPVIIYIGDDTDSDSDFTESEDDS